MDQSTLHHILSTITLVKGDTYRIRSLRHIKLHNVMKKIYNESK